MSGIEQTHSSSIGEQNQHTCAIVEQSTDTQQKGSPPELRDKVADLQIRLEEEKKKNDELANKLLRVYEEKQNFVVHSDNLFIQIGENRMIVNDKDPLRMGHFDQQMKFMEILEEIHTEIDGCKGLGKEEEMRLKYVKCLANPCTSIMDECIHSFNATLSKMDHAACTFKSLPEEAQFGLMRINRRYGARSNSPITKKIFTEKLDLEFDMAEYNKDAIDIEFCCQVLARWVKKFGGDANAKKLYETFPRLSQYTPAENLYAFDAPPPYSGIDPNMQQHLPPQYFQQTNETETEDDKSYGANANAHHKSASPSESGSSVSYLPAPPAYEEINSKKKQPEGI